jgi:hypothetical protein
MSIVEREWEWHFAVSPEALWPLVADTARIGEANGFPRYTLTETPLPDGSVERIGRARKFGTTITWDEGVPEWATGRWYRQERRFHNRLIRGLASRILLDPEPGGTRLRYRTTFEVAWPLALVLRYGGLRQAGKTFDRLFREAARTAATNQAAGFAEPIKPVPAVVRNRVAAQTSALRERGYPLAERLGEHLLDAPESAVERMRPRRLARQWQAAPRAVIETCLAAVREGLLTLRWDLVCPLCRGAKVTVTSLDQLPKGAHCPSCNIDYEGDFARNVEVTFEPAPAVRDISGGSFCLANPLLSEHVKVQQRLARVRRPRSPPSCPTASIACVPSSRAAAPILPWPMGEPRSLH